jgi:catechol 2,3-dioxygenase-like lactoylglutathione lyase family enzyme
MNSSAIRAIAQITLVVRDYDEAITWFTRCLKFRLIEDTPLGGGKRWVVVAPSETAGAALLLYDLPAAERIAQADFGLARVVGRLSSVEGVTA